MGVIESSLKKNLGLRTYDNDRAANLNIGAMKFDMLCNKYGTNDPATGDGLDGTVIHEAYITDDGTDATGTSGVMNASDVPAGTIGDIVIITMVSGIFAINTWAQASNGEKLWITAWVPGTGALTVVRGQLGTAPTLIKRSTKIFTLGDTLNESVYSKPFYSEIGYWTQIKCISGSSASGVDGVRMQANNLGGDNITLSSANTYNPSFDGGSSADYYMAMSPGDIIYGKFNRVCIDEPNSSSGDAASKLILYKG